jgi:hypothetical protein
VFSSEISGFSIDFPSKTPVSVDKRLQFCLSLISVKNKPIYRFLTIAMAFLVLLNGLGVFVIDYAQIGIHRIFEYADHSAKNVQQLQMSGNEFTSLFWVGERDFIFKGNVYDMDNVSATKGKVTVTCHQDEEETAVKNSIADNFENPSKNSAAPKTVKDVFKIFPVFPCFEKMCLNIPEHSSSFNFKIHHTGTPVSVVLEFIVPPPQAA